MTKGSGTPYRDLSDEERIALTHSAIETGRTVIERWVALDDFESNPWSARSEIAARFLLDADSVADFGCGVMQLARHLRPDQAYLPIDVVARDQRTIVCDFNRQDPPETSAAAAACLGLVEYLHDPLRFLSRLRLQYRLAVVSYVTWDSSHQIRSRRKHAWVNDFDKAGIMSLFGQAGWTILQEQQVLGSQHMWKLTA